MDKTQQTHSGIELQEHEWKEIRKIARDMYESKQYNQDQFKIAVMAFMKYAVEYEKRIMSMINLEGPIH